MMLVHAAMTQPAGAMCERFAADAAVMRPDTIVLHAVRPRRRQMQEPFAANLAVVARVTVVYRRTVTSHGRNVREASVTLRTLVRTLSRVHGQVLLQVAELCELSTARVTCEWAHVVVQVRVYLHHTFIIQLKHITTSLLTLCQHVKTYFYCVHFD